MIAPDAPAMPTLRMDGNPVFRWASYEMAKVAQEALDRAGVAVDDLECSSPIRPICASSTRWPRP